MATRTTIPCMSTRRDEITIDYRRLAFTNQKVMVEKRVEQNEIVLYIYRERPARRSN
ncbi:hypothetical protein AFERRI_560034 [Acidithiobacillus ferrivorans]|uniref:Uncharacterized protein n=1 Tax=Acidithiobacillus ferrivorans TaxID=160808 RepID=A0A060USY4_9PROT|nr:hypothetical protein AFERRI_560034 [Acidithiobacillus ferrivorans]